MRYIALFLIFKILFALNDMQLYYLNKTFNKAKEFNLQYTMSAIAYVESSLGKKLINYNSKDCGIFQINTDELKTKQWKKDKICARLVLDYDFSFSVALDKFKYFENYWISKGYNKNISWKYAIMSYHCGFNIRRTKCRIYYKKIIKAMHVIKNIEKKKY